MSFFRDLRSHLGSYLVNVSSNSKRYHACVDGLCVMFFFFAYYIIINNIAYLCMLSFSSILK